MTGSPTSGTTPGTPLRTCAAGVVFALDVEADAFAARSRDTTETLAGGLTFHEGTVAGRRVAWVVAGTGIDRAARACRLLIDGHRPRLIISAGFAGGLTPQLPRGRLMNPARVLRADHPPLDLGAGDSAAHAQPSTTLVTVDRVVCTAVEKRTLAAATGADLVDMETWGVATVARDARLDCVSLRVVSDTATDDLPDEMARLVQPQSSLRRFGAALRAIGRRPAAAADMWRLWEHAVIDGRTLADALERAIAALPLSDR